MSRYNNPKIDRRLGLLIRWLILLIAYLGFGIMMGWWIPEYWVRFEAYAATCGLILVTVCCTGKIE